MIVRHSQTVDDKGKQAGRYETKCTVPAVFDLEAEVFRLVAIYGWVSVNRALAKRWEEQVDEIKQMSELEREKHEAAAARVDQ